MKQYVLDENKNIVEATDIFSWGMFFENFENRKVEQTIIKGYTVSTVFLGIDMRGFHSPDQKPILFETMIFDPDGEEAFNNYQERFCTWDEAVEGHRKACELVRG